MKSNCSGSQSVSGKPSLQSESISSPPLPTLYCSLRTPKAGSTPSGITTLLIINPVWILSSFVVKLSLLTTKSGSTTVLFPFTTISSSVFAIPTLSTSFPTRLQCAVSFLAFSFGLV